MQRMFVCLFDLGFEQTNNACLFVCSIWGSSLKTVLHVRKEARAEIPKRLTMVDDSDVTQVSKNNEAQVMSCG